MRRQDDTTGVAAPLFGVQTRIVLGQTLGLPHFPKIVSTKSRLLNRPAGAKNRISMVFSEQKPGTAGQTKGRISSETKHSAGCGLSTVNGSRINSAGG
jgi:hypothetical protein